MSIETMEAGRWHSLWSADHFVPWPTGRGMSFELYQHKVGVLERHCEAVGRDPAEIKHTLLMPLKVTDDKAEAERYNKGLGRMAMDRTESLRQLLE